MKRFITVTAMCAFGILIVLSCGCTQKAAVSKPIKPQVAEVGAHLNGDLAKGCPDDLPQWEGATVKKSSYTRKMNEVYELELLIDAPYDKVLYGYGKGFKDCGWNPQTVSQDDTSTLISAIKNNESAAITLNDNQHKTTTVVVSIQMQ